MPNRRRLLLLLDGTWNDADTDGNDTNIVRLRNIFADELVAVDNAPIDLAEVVSCDHSGVELGIRRYNEIDYVFFYERGVGTGPGLDRLTGGALGWGLSTNIRRAYKFLSNHYTVGAEIFIFGFSRGAYTARSLVGMLGASGLLKPEFCDNDLEGLAWSNYRTSPNDRFPALKRKLEPFTFPTSELRVSCLGVFDTVGALGIPTTALRRLNRQFYEFHDVELSPIVRLNLHALAVDEHRQPFAASVWRQNRFRWSNSITEQTWFTGVHADVGGGYISDDARNTSIRPLDDISLDWMIKRVQHHYSDFPSLSNTFASMYGASGLAFQHNSRTWKYKYNGPALRSIGNLKVPTFGREKLVSRDRNKMVVGESIHISVLNRLGYNSPYDKGKIIYAPRNILEVLPNLLERYCHNQTREWGPEAISVTLWNGAVVHEQRSSESELSEARNALNDAASRLGNKIT